MKHVDPSPAIQPVQHAPGSPDTCMFMLQDAARSVQDRLERALEQRGLSSAKYMALDALVKAGEPLTLSDLARRLHCVRSNITQLVDRLEADGLVRRVSDSADRRAVRAVVTELGSERHAAGLEATNALQARFAETVSPAEHVMLRRILSSLI